MPCWGHVLHYFFTVYPKFKFNCMFSIFFWQSCLGPVSPSAHLLRELILQGPDQTILRSFLWRSTPPQADVTILALWSHLTPNHQGQVGHLPRLPHTVYLARGSTCHLTPPAPGCPEPRRTNVEKRDGKTSET